MINELADLFNKYCEHYNLDIGLSFEMPNEYRNVLAKYDNVLKKLYLNTVVINSLSRAERFYYFFKEIRYAIQYEHPENFDEWFIKCLNYLIYDSGDCCKLIDGIWHSCHLNGDANYFHNANLNLPSNIDANYFAYNEAQYYDSDISITKEIHSNYSPKIDFDITEFEKLFERIDEEIK